MRTIFWNVDTQYDFMRSDSDYCGKLPVPDAQLIEENLSKLTRHAKEKNIQVVNSGDWHTEESKEFSDEPDYKNTFPPHCLIGTKGAQFVEASRPESSYVVDWREDVLDTERVRNSRNVTIYKDAFDIFAGSKHSEKVVQTIDPDRAIVYGVATNVCVDFAVRGLIKRGVDVYVATDAIKELPNLASPLETWVEAGAKLTTTKEVLEGRI